MTEAKTAQITEPEEGFYSGEQQQAYKNKKKGMS